MFACVSGTNLDLVLNGTWGHSVLPELLLITVFPITRSVHTAGSTGAYSGIHHPGGTCQTIATLRPAGR
ncbi:hypothetical protein SXCC_00571 [Gluconacetobacter sp. SXCC-1]|nr:hypothetical protein SXCC_00571 [Gluconacetobacter sp. SXCC-1]